MDAIIGKFLSIKEFAVLLGVHQCTIRRAIFSGKIIALKIGRSYRIPYNEIERKTNESLEETVRRLIKENA